MRYRPARLSTVAATEVMTILYGVKPPRKSSSLTSGLSLSLSLRQSAQNHRELIERLTALAVVIYVLAVLAPPHDVRLREPGRFARQRHVGSLAHHHVGAGLFGYNRRWYCNTDVGKIAFSRRPRRRCLPLARQ